MTRKTVLPTLSLAVVVVTAAPALSQTRVGPDEAAIKARFVGHYELVSYVSFADDGEAIDREYSGRIMYDEHGNMSAIGMPNDLPERASRSDTNVQGGFAYWGSVSFDLERGVVIHHVEGSPTRGSWPGVDNVRYFEFTDDGLLKLSLRNDEGRTTGTLTWKRIEG